MIEVIPLSERQGRLVGSGLAVGDILTFLQDLEALRIGEPGDRRATKLDDAAHRLGHVCRQGRALLDRLPPKSKREVKEKAAGHAIVHLLADASWRFFRLYRKHIYDALTNSR